MIEADKAKLKMSKPVTKTKSQKEKIPNFFFKDMLDRIRKNYKIAKDIPVYMFTDSSFGKRLKQFDKLKRKVNFKDMDIHEEKEFDLDMFDGIYENDYFKIVAIKTMEGFFYFLFTEDLKRFGKEFFKKKLTIKNGLYKMKRTQLGIVPERINVKNVVRPILNNDLFKELNEEIKNFEKKEGTYKENGLDYKRGILLYGLPGNGKTCFIKHILDKTDAFSLICERIDHESIQFISGITRNKILKDRLKIIVIEDIDGVDQYDRSNFLNMMDGVGTMNKVIFIATTNFPEKLDIGISDRPGRFDSLYEIELPNKDSRKELINFYFGKSAPKEIDRAVRETKCFTGAYFKELYIMTILHNIDIFEAITKLKSKFKAFKDFADSNKEATNYYG